MDYLNPHGEIFKETYSGLAGATLGRGQTFMDWFNTDQFSEARVENLYYPFVSRQDWEVGSWLLRSGLSMAAIDEFLSLEIVRLISYISVDLHLIPVSTDSNCRTFFF